MKIRSITFFIHPDFTAPEKAVELAGRYATVIRPIFNSAGFEVQSMRLATTPFSEINQLHSTSDYVGYAAKMDFAAVANGFDYVSLGPAQMNNPKSFDAVPEMLAGAQNLFLSGQAGLYESGLNTGAVRRCAEVIHRCAQISPDGFGNLRFTMLANVPAGAPFFPAAYAQGDTPSFALAIEAADVAIDSFSNAVSLTDARQSLTSQIGKHAKKLTELAEAASRQSGCRFAGLDFTPAPYPDKKISLGTALESLGVPAVGMAGSLAAAALLAETLNRGDYRRVGFNGLMLPVLEDATLAQRAAEGILTISDLLLYSAVCGTGLDCIPLPGETSVEQLYALLLDVAVLALRLNKPLTARLMPIPGKQAGDDTHFEFGYFANSKVMILKAAPLSGALAGDETIQLYSRADLLKE